MAMASTAADFLKRMTRAGLGSAAALTLLLAACAGPPPTPPATPAAAVAPAAPVATAPPSTPALPPERTTSSPAPSAMYVCRTTAKGETRDLPLDMPQGVDALCRKHPETGPCQYEREKCRHTGGRVFDQAGIEITRKTEAEYDKKVLRVKFRS